MTDAPELKSCPFCGGEAEMRGDLAPENWVACKADCQPSGRNKPHLIAAWNTRAQPAPADPVECQQAPETRDNGICLSPTSINASDEQRVEAVAEAIDGGITNYGLGRIHQVAAHVIQRDPATAQLVAARAEVERLKQGLLQARFTLRSIATHTNPETACPACIEWAQEAAAAIDKLIGRVDA